MILVVTVPADANVDYSYICRCKRSDQTVQIQVTRRAYAPATHVVRGSIRALQVSEGIILKMR